MLQNMPEKDQTGSERKKSRQLENMLTWRGRCAKVERKAENTAEGWVRRVEVTVQANREN